MTTKASLDTKVVEFTRSQYMNKACTHQEFYIQFVTSSIRKLVETKFGDRIRRSTNEWFNDIPLKEWDFLADITFRTMNREAWRAAVCPHLDRGLLWSMSDNVCILKAAAQEIRQAAAVEAS